MNIKYGFRSILKTSVIIALIAFSSAAAALSWINSSNENPPELGELLKNGERYEYQVRYGFFRLGNIYVTVKDTLIEDQPNHLISAVMVSNSGLPFVGYREYHFNSIVKENRGDITTSYFWIDEVHRERYPFNSYTFDYDNGLLYSYEYRAKLDTLTLSEITYGGPELILFARNHSGSGQTYTYPIAIDNEIKMVTANYTTEREFIRSGLTGKRQRVIRTDGFADLDGPFGFSGRFRGYVTDDELRLPIETRLSVWIGNATIRLVGYERG
jgi:hypothetical protein